MYGMMDFNLKLADVSLPVSFSFPKTAEYFREYCMPPTEAPVRYALSDDDWEWSKQFGFSRNAEAEFSLFAGAASEALLDSSCCVFHGVAFSFAGRAWIITAPSGVGKSTQIKTLQELYPGEFSVICGDRPVLKLLDDERVMVYPSPWNGKENWYGAPAAPLEGIVFLCRGEENELKMLKRNSAVFPLYYSMIHNVSCEEKIRQIAAFEDALLRRVPVWRLSNKGIPDSTVLLYKELFIKG